jgi:Virulence-associated protein E/Bifunctional DNA primase/polymerase, N-terminal
MSEHNKNNRHFALKAAELGLSVFPCGADKKPLVKWRDESTTDPKQIHQWWTQWSNPLPGIDLAKSGLLVLDGDRHANGNGIVEQDGVAALEHLFAEHEIDPASVPAVLTPSDGRHRYFRQPEGEPLGNSEGELRGRGINVRGAGGYVIAPGAQLPDGRRYAWDKATPNIFTALREGTIIVLPPPIAKALRNGSRSDEPIETAKQTIKTKSNGSNNHIRGSAYAAAALNGCAKELAATAPGGRNNRLNELAFRLGTMVARGWISRSQVEQVLLEAARACGLVKEDGIQSVRATIKSGLDAGMLQPHPDLEDRPTSAPTARAAEQPEFDRGKDKNPKATCANARVAITALGIDCRYDIFHDKLLVGGYAIAQYAGELSDHACLVVRELIFQQYGFDPGRIHTLDAWLQTYLGAEDTPLNRAIGKLALLAMVRRAHHPGCKFDQIIVFESPEGTLESTALAALAGSPENFSDQTILGLSDQQQQERLRGKWVYEISDLSGIRKAEVEQVKAFASRTHDRARPAYGRSLVELPRRCVIFGTTNEETYLKSRTGNRRFWPVRTSTIDVAALARDRDQLLAEAAALEATGAPLTLPTELWNAATAAQEGRLEHDPWLDTLATLEGTSFESPDARGEEERIACDELLSAKLNIPAQHQTDAIGKRLAYVMRKLGWDGPKKMRFGQGRTAPSKRGYSRACSTNRE